MSWRDMTEDMKLPEFGTYEEESRLMEQLAVQMAEMMPKPTRIKAAIRECKAELLTMYTGEEFWENYYNALGKIVDYCNIKLDEMEGKK